MNKFLKTLKQRISPRRFLYEIHYARWYSNFMKHTQRLECYNARVFSVLKYPFQLSFIELWASSIAVRALAYYAENYCLGSTSSQWLDARSLSTQQQMGASWKSWEGQRQRGKELATLPHRANCPGQVSSLTGASPNVQIVYGTYFFL